MDEEFDPPLIDQETCGRPDCICALPIGERFLLWALRQWQCELINWRDDRELPPEGSVLLRGFSLAGLRDTLSHFATLMDVLLFGARRAFAIHAPSCSSMSSDEAAVIALCSLAQGDRDGLLLASLDLFQGPQRTPPTIGPLPTRRRRCARRNSQTVDHARRIDAGGARDGTPGGF